MNSHNRPIWLHWAKSKVVDANWGDALNPVLVSYLAQRPVLHAKELPSGTEESIYSAIGSHLSKSNANWTVWGTGFIDSADTIKAAPREIAAVRGPLSRRKLQELDVDCPEIFGDAAIFFPCMHQPPREVRWELGVIQHVREAGVVPLPAQDEFLSVKVIDITGELTAVIDEITSCRRIVSSSLHGIIASHSFGVPATWVKFSDKPVGDGFKFKDYWASVGRFDIEPFIPTAETTMKDLAALRSPIANAIDTDKLIAACPFIDDDRRAEISSQMRGQYRMHEIVGQ
ncbi:polysaccharide pyruvyl transferase family protein [Pararoseomonas indoligenes]|uniref:Polysaccharide pyruvyl transferase family protein n=1 Tax=Roseomonas indoligenes TaxID=2820811 RepID=A0A940N1U7_9PROT|nr:polysaccharide pyruvyl transferase family protein [Pararoseomonas indoligenes]MBP0495698.1 polysaccharide pyruvyl transferase family protein [Pararoseomonas indoligenes]